MENLETHILIVDDESEIRDIFRESLEAMGHVCFAAPNGEAALQVMATEKIDLALVDLRMPGMSGQVLFEHMVAQHRDVAVIFVTAMDDVDIAVRNLKFGAFDYLVKPVPLRRLRQAIEEALHRCETMLAEKTELRVLDDERNRQLDQRTREVAALNRLFQKHMRERSAVAEAFRTVLDGLDRLAQRANTLAELDRSIPSDVMDGPAVRKTT